MFVGQRNCILFFCFVFYFLLFYITVTCKFTLILICIFLKEDKNLEINKIIVIYGTLV